MLADVVDYGRWRFGTDYAGTYFAFYTMVQKINVGIGSAVGLAVAGFFGFDATVAEQTSSGVLGLKLGVAVLPAITYVIATVLIWKFPITRRRQRAIVRAIERRDEFFYYHLQRGLVRKELGQQSSAVTDLLQ